MSFLRFALAAVLGLGATAAGRSEAVSFDCGRASNEAERLICFDSELSLLDDEMSSCYATKRRGGERVDQLRREQLEWLSRRNACGTMGCVAREYESRLAELGCDDRGDGGAVVGDQGQPIIVQLRSQGGVLTVPVSINDRITLDFVVDSGAADVSIPADVVLTLFRTGSLTADDFIGKRTYRLADGSSMPSNVFRIRSLKVGGRVLENVIGSVAPVEGTLLLGQSFLSRFRTWSIDNGRRVLVLE